jgi:hypothetical protein
MGLRGSGAKLKEHIWAAASATMEEWTNQELQPCSLYGIRVYKEGAIMLPHVRSIAIGGIRSYQRSGEFTKWSLGCSAGVLLVLHCISSSS